MAREGQSDRFFLQKRHYIYKLWVKRQKTGQKTGKKPPKKQFFPAPPAVCMGLAWNVAQHLRPCLKWCAKPGLRCCATFQAWPEMLQHSRPGLKCCATSQAKPIRTAGGAGKSRFFGGFLPVFCPVVCIFPICIHIIRIFKKKIGSSQLFLAARATDTKVRRSTGVATANSTNKYQKYKSVELGDQLLATWQYNTKYADFHHKQLHS